MFVLDEAAARAFIEVYEATIGQKASENVVAWWNFKTDQTNEDAFKAKVMNES